MPIDANTGTVEVPDLDVVAERIAAARTRACGSEHELRIAKGIPQCLRFQLKRAGILPDDRGYLCEDRASICNCAHRSSEALPDPFLTEIRALASLNILDASWSNHAQQLRSVMLAYDHQVNWYVDQPNPPSLELRQAHQQQIIQQITELQTALLTAINQAKNQPQSLPLPCPLPTPTLTAAPWFQSTVKQALGTRLARIALHARQAILQSLRLMRF